MSSRATPFLRAFWLFYPVAAVILAPMAVVAVVRELTRFMLLLQTASLAVLSLMGIAGWRVFRSIVEVSAADEGLEVRGIGVACRVSYSEVERVGRSIATIVLFWRGHRLGYVEFKQPQACGRVIRFFPAGELIAGKHPVDYLRDRVDTFR